MTAGVEVYLCMNEISENSDLKLQEETSSTETTGMQAVHDEINNAQLTSIGVWSTLLFLTSKLTCFQKRTKRLFKKKMFFKWSLLLCFLAGQTQGTTASFCSLNNGTSFTAFFIALIYTVKRICTHAHCGQKYCQANVNYCSLFLCKSSYWCSRGWLGYTSIHQHRASVISDINR